MSRDIGVVVGRIHLLFTSTLGRSMYRGPLVRWTAHRRRNDEKAIGAGSLGGMPRRDFQQCGSPGSPLAPLASLASLASSSPLAPSRPRPLICIEWDHCLLDLCGTREGQIVFVRNRQVACLSTRLDALLAPSLSLTEATKYAAASV